MEAAQLLARRQRMVRMAQTAPPAVARNLQRPGAGKARLEALRKAGVAGAAAVSDIERILALPLNFPLDEGEEEALNREVLLADAWSSGSRLLKAQVNGFYQYLRWQGAFLPIGVGHGKTLLGLMVADKSFRDGMHSMCLMCPPNLVPQLMLRGFRFARTLVPFNVPVHNLHGMSVQRRRTLVRRCPRGLYIFPYSLLSMPDAEELLNTIKPEIVIADEAHRLANFTAARSRRFSRFMEDHSPRFVAMSGTITSKSIVDYAHLARWALGDNCFLPTRAGELNEWAAQVDAVATTYGTEGNTFSTGRLVEWARDVTGEPIEHCTTGFRQAYRVRLTTAPGVYSTGDSSVACALILANNQIPDETCRATEGWNKLQDLIKGVEKLSVAPCGDEIEHAMQKFRWLYELSAGFYNNLVWPEAEDLAERRGIPEGEAFSLLERAIDCHMLGQEYASLLRKYLEGAPPGLDTPFLVGGHCYQHLMGRQPLRVPGWLYSAWKKHKDAEFEGMPERDSYPVRVCPYKVDFGAKWAASLPKKEGGIIWTHNQAALEWQVEACREAGIQTVACPAGGRYDEEIIDPNNADKVIVASISAHGEGKDLQHFQHQLFLQWPRPAKTAEQLLGRLHRTGQRAEELRSDMCMTLPFDHMLLAACLNDALYIHQTLGSPQKLVTADYDPMPRQYPAGLMEERGMDPRRLDPATLRLKQAVFGE